MSSCHTVFCLANYVDFLVQSAAFLETSPVSLLCPQKSVQELWDKSKQWLRELCLQCLRLEYLLRSMEYNWTVLAI